MADDVTSYANRQRLLALQQSNSYRNVVDKINLGKILELRSRRGLSRPKEARTCGFRTQARKRRSQCQFVFRSYGAYDYGASIVQYFVLAVILDSHQSAIPAGP